MLEQLERSITEFLMPEVKTVLEIGNYIASAGGKRVRPILMLETARMLGGDTERLIPLAVGIEYIHMASLLHDDVVDGADVRRGRPSANRVFGNPIVVLTGDYMYARALWLYSLYGNMKSIEIVSRAVMQMAEGQVLELLHIGKIIDEETYLRIVDGKTGALFGASMGVGALMSGYPGFEEFYRMGVKVGRAFQMVDDALDYIGDQKVMGKPAGNDLREGKCTYPLLSVLHTMDRSKLEESLRKGDVEEIRSKVVELGGVEKTKSRAKKEIEEVISYLKSFPQSDKLIELLVSLVERVR